MQKSLKNFKSRGGRDGDNGGNGGNNGNSDGVRELLGKYGNMSEDALFAALMQQVASEKSEGTFDINKLSASLGSMRPYLTKAQNEKLDHLMGLIGS